MARPTTKQPNELVYDSGASIAAERDDRRFWAIHARALQRGVRPIVPAPCVVEVWRGSRQRSLDRVLEHCEIEHLDADRAKLAGALRRGVSSDAGPVDAVVVEVALRRRGAVVTADRSDIARLANASRRRIDIIDV